ncbi:MAG: hypothetical protein IPL16_06855 [Ignavibacteria bacterium]|nr:hypothetical protein [Ignavibacteria bacterium]
MRSVIRVQMLSFCSFRGYPLRVPGSETDLLKIRAKGKDVRIVYSHRRCHGLASQSPPRQVCILCSGV